MILLEFDKAGAEWVIVAYLSGDPTMIDVIESGKSPHVVTGSLMSGLSEELVKQENKLLKDGKMTDPDEIDKAREPILALLSGAKMLPRTMSIRQMGKKSNHGLNYREKYRMFALINEIEEREAMPIVEAYSTTVYPGIKTGFWDVIDAQIKKDRTLINCFNRKVQLLDEWGPDLLKAATSFIPQSTVGDMVNRALVRFYNDSHIPALRAADLLTQTHDSGTFQFPTNDFTLMGEFAARFAYDYLSPEIEYNFRKFRIGTDLKIGLDWGHMVEVSLVDNAQELGRNIKFAWDKLRAGAETKELAPELS